MGFFYVVSLALFSKLLPYAAVICMNGLSFGGACSVPALSNFNDMIVALLVKIGMFMRSNLIVFVIAELNSV